MARRVMQIPPAEWWDLQTTDTNDTLDTTDTNDTLDTNDSLVLNRESLRCLIVRHISVLFRRKKVPLRSYCVRVKGPKNHENPSGFRGRTK